MGVREVRKVMETAAGLCLEGRKAWYNMKFDRRLLMPFENDGDVVSLMRGNDGHAYVYVAGVGGPSAGAAVGGEQQQHRCHCESHVVRGGGVGGAGSGTQLVQGDGSGDAAPGKVVRVDAAHHRRLQSVEGVVQVTSGSDRADEESSHSESASDSDDDRKAVVWARSGVEAEDYIRRRTVWKNVIKGVGQIFSSADACRYTIWKYAIANKFEYYFVRNCRQRIAVKCVVEGCEFYICVRGHRRMDGMIVKDFKGVHVHTVGEECQMGRWGRRMMRAKLLARLIDGRVRLSMDYSPTEIMKDFELELGLRMTYMQAWRSREYVRLLVMGRPEDHYKLLPWMCAAIERANPDSRAFVELEGSRFKRMFVAYGACLNGFILGCRKMLFVDGSHLSGPYEGTLLAAVALDADNHLLDVAYAVVEGKKNEE